MLRGYVVTGLDQKWSPEQISHRMVVDFPADPRMRVCTETIFQAIYAPDRTGLTRAAAPVLRCRRVASRPQRDPARRRSRFVEPMVPITDRPAEAEDRTAPGHGEGDLIIGQAASGAAVGTLLERTTRYVILLHLPTHHGPATVAGAMIAAMAHLPEQLRRSLAWDRGQEMAHHEKIRMELSLPVYFCDPHSPWQRGSNENTNRPLRHWFPKNTTLENVTAAELQRVQNKLNTRPRPTLGLRTPAQALAGLLETEPVATTT